MEKHEGGEDPPSPDAREVTVTISGDALMCATAFGEGNPAKGVDHLLRVVAAIWLQIQDEHYAVPPQDEVVDENGVEKVDAFGVTARLDLVAAVEALSVDIGDKIGIAVRDKIDSGDVWTPDEVEELSVLAAACTIDRGPEFTQIVAARITHTLYDTYGDAIAAILSDVNRHWATSPPFTIEQRKELVKSIKDAVVQTKNADETLCGLPLKFSRMVGGISGARLLKEPSAEEWAAYGALVERLTPTWKVIMGMRNAYPETWKQYVIDHASKELVGDELKAFHVVMKYIPNQGGNLNSAKIGPIVCAREHARIVIGISRRSDKELALLTPPLRTTED